MGAVYEARDIKLERPVAVKILSAELTRQPDMVRRLFREARAASQIRHPNIVEYLDYDQIADGPAYLVMELLNGGDLERVLKQRGPIPWPTLAPWLREACLALSAAHRAGIIHRDIKPSNFVLVERPGLGDPFLKLVDFGIVKLTPLSGLRGDTEMTQNLLGTEMFMAPELFTGVTPNPRTDVYALGVSIYRLLTGKYPRSETYEPPPPSHFCPGVPPEVDALVAKCIDVRPLVRFASMQAVDAAILETLAVKDASTGFPRAPVTAPVPVPSSGPWHRFWVGGAALLAACTLMVTLLWRPTTPRPADAPPHIVASEPEITTPHEVPQELPKTPPDAAPAPVTVPAPVAVSTPAPVPAPPTIPDPLPSIAQPDAGPTREGAAPLAPPFSDRAARKLLDTLAARASECGRRENLLPGGKVELSIAISPDGIPRARAKKRGTLAHVKCIIKLVDTLRFARSAAGGEIAHEYKL